MRAERRSSGRFSPGQAPAFQRKECFVNMDQLFSDQALLGVFLLLLPVCLAASVYFLSAGQPAALLRGLWRTFLDLLFAPFAYMRHTVARLSREGGQSVQASASDAQFLMRTMVRIQMAVLFLALSVVCAGGLILAIHAGIPEEAAAKRKQALQALQQMKDDTIPAIESEIRELSSQLGDRAALRREYEEKKASIRDLDAKMASLREELENGGHGSYFAIIRTYLEAESENLRSEGGRRGVRAEVVNFLRKVPTSSDFDQRALDYLELAEQRAAAAVELAELEPASRSAALALQKEKAELRLREAKRTAQELEQEASLSRLFAAYSAGEFWKGLGVLLLFLWLILWAGGLSIEYAELFIDMATNLRAVRAHHEKIAPAGPLPSVPPAE